MNGLPSDHPCPLPPTRHWWEWFLPVDPEDYR